MPTPSEQLDRIATREKRLKVLVALAATATILVLGFLFYGGLSATAKITFKSAAVVAATVSEAKDYPIAALEVDFEGVRIAVVGPKELGLLRSGEAVCIRQEETIFGTVRYIATTNVYCPGIGQ